MSAKAPKRPAAAGGAFLAGAASRLLPPSVPLRFFGAAIVFHALGWLALLAGSPTLPRFAGGLGWTLAGLHLMTLGVLVMTAIGASLQLLPVATRQPLGSFRWPALLWWLYTPGVAVVALGMGLGAVAALAAGGAAVLTALVIYAILLARNLRGARGMPVVLAHGWTALASLVLVLASAAALVLAYAGLPTLGRTEALALHVAFAAFGFMGMLALGFSYILVPMFALARAPNERRALTSCALAALGLVLAGVAAFGAAAPALRILAILSAAVAVGLHLQLMRTALKTGMRRELGRSFRLVRIGWALLAVTLAAALALVLDAPFDGMATLFGLVLIGGWLLTFALGILQRVMPFLASMHKPPGKGPPRTPSSLTDDRPLAVHFWCHLAALALLAVAIAADSAWLAALAALVGAAGAVAFLVFFVILLRRMRRPAQAAHARNAPVA
ncbi:MAG: hypothetical protein J0H00_10980 [Burkholderiales bacterium]|nr:hypothetical protein [Burkholderiales bacterium]OJX04541.1 MAG: hypothetical protein BGO72_21230 [Burkholderiales bacterium 70-64]